MDNIMAFPDINQIKDEAAEWVVKIHGQTYQTGHGLPEDMANELRVWLNLSDLHRESFLAMLSGWDAMAVLEDLADILPLADAPPTAEPNKAAGFNPLQGLAIAASVVVIALVTLLFPSNNHYSTDIGEQASYTLSDGSILTLNTNSEVSIDYSDSRRAVTLHRGEANFEVAKNRQRPFVVFAGEGLVWAVGTAFNVSYQNDLVDVVVSEGKVKVYSGIGRLEKLPPLSITEATAPNKKSRDVMLIAGEGATYQNTIVSKEALAKPALDKKLAWQVGALMFEGETLEQAVREISRYTEQQLLIVDSSIRLTRVGGRFKTDDIDGLLSSLAKSLDIKIEKGEGSQLLFSANKPTQKANKIKQ